jgi:hypothetical protein
MATLKASDAPAIQSRKGSVRRSRKSLMTANGGAKVPMVFLPPWRFMAVLTPTAASFCASTVGGHAHHAEAAVDERGGEAGRVEQRPATDADDVRLAVHAVLEHRVDQGHGQAVIVLRGLAAGQQDGIGDELHGVGMHGEPVADAVGEARVGVEHRAFRDDHRAMTPAGLAAAEDVEQQAVFRREKIAAEEHGEVERHGEPLLVMPCRRGLGWVGHVLNHCCMNAPSAETVRGSDTKSEVQNQATSPSGSVVPWVPPTLAVSMLTEQRRPAEEQLAGIETGLVVDVHVRGEIGRLLACPSTTDRRTSGPSPPRSPGPRSVG